MKSRCFGLWFRCVIGHECYKGRRKLLGEQAIGQPVKTTILGGSCGFSRMSAAGSSPATSSPSHRRITGPIRRAKGGWTPEEDETLKHAVELHKGGSWKTIAKSVPGRTEVQCLHRWQKVLNPELVKGSWAPVSAQVFNLNDALVIEVRKKV